MLVGGATGAAGAAGAAGAGATKGEVCGAGMGGEAAGPDGDRLRECEGGDAAGPASRCATRGAGSEQAGSIAVAGVAYLPHARGERWAMGGPGRVESWGGVETGVMGGRAGSDIPRLSMGDMDDRLGCQDGARAAVAG